MVLLCPSNGFTLAIKSSRKFDKKEYGNDKYDRIVSSIDYWLKQFLENIDLKNTFLVITADHGCVIPFDGKDITDFEPDLNLGLN